MRKTKVRGVLSDAQVLHRDCRFHFGIDITDTYSSVVATNHAVGIASCGISPVNGKCMMMKESEPLNADFGSWNGAAQANMNF